MAQGDSSNPRLERPDWSVERVLDRFEAAWKRGTPPPISAFLGAPSTLKPLDEESRRKLLVELIKVDLEYRWRVASSNQQREGRAVGAKNVDSRAIGKPISVRPLLTDYLAQFPELGPLESLPIDLIAEEYRARQRWGDRPTHDEFMVPFAHMAPHLREALVQIDSEVSCEGGQAETVSVELSTQSVQKGSRAAPRVAEANRQVRRLGRFELRAELGAGGFGRVYRAYDPQLKREVALKVARSEHLSSPKDTSRFFREARSAAQLKHPNIVPIHDVGQEGQTAYIVQALIDGLPLDRALAKRRFAALETVRLVLKLADALHYAHQRGVFHRDIKPGNVMLDNAGSPHLMDFGLARRVEGDELKTKAGVIMGTPAYMSPEQARGERELVDARSDQYSLAVLLYEMLCGQRPFSGSTWDILRKVQTQELPPPRRLNRQLSIDLETVCLKALAKDPSQRYPTVQHFAEDLERWLEHRPVTARRAGPVVRAVKWARRNPLGAAFGVMTAAAVLFICVYFATRPGYVDLRVIPSAAAASLNGALITLTDGRALVPRGPGRYTLEVTAEGYESQKQEISVVRGRNNATLLNLELRSNFGYLQLDSTPGGAAVEVLDSADRVVAKGTTPFHSSKLRADQYVVNVSKDLYLPEQISIEVPTGDRVAGTEPVVLKAAVEGPESYERLRAMRKALAQPIAQPWDFTETPLSEVLKSIQESQFVSIVIDGSAQRFMDARITLQVERGSLEFALKSLLEEFALTYVPKNVSEGSFALLITAQADATGRPETVMYPVGDLLLNRDQGAINSLIQGMTNQVAPTTWSKFGGPGTISYLAAGRTLSISQWWWVHEMVDEYLTGLRRARAGGTAGDSEPATTSSESDPSGALWQAAKKVAECVSEDPAPLRELLSPAFLKDVPWETVERLCGEAYKWGGCVPTVELATRHSAQHADFRLLFQDRKQATLCLHITPDTSEIIGLRMRYKD